MNIEAHLDSLNAKHAKIEQSIHSEEHRPAPDLLRLQKLKKEKLKLKEEIHQFAPH